MRTVTFPLALISTLVLAQQSPTPMEEREAALRFGLDDCKDHGRQDLFIEPEFSVWLSKAPHTCDDIDVAAHRRDGQYWSYTLRHFYIPENPKKALFYKQRFFMIVEEPEGKLCTWRFLEPGQDWDSVPEMIRTWTIAPCDELVKAVAVKGASEKTLTALKASLAKPKPADFCGKDKIMESRLKPTTPKK
jgi:hypothetical protein